MKRSQLLQRRLTTPIEAIQVCRDIVEGNFNAADIPHEDRIIELVARIFTDIEVLAAYQDLDAFIAAGTVYYQQQQQQGYRFLTSCDPGDENTEPSSAGR